MVGLVRLILGVSFLILRLFSLLKRKVCHVTSFFIIDIPLNIQQNSSYVVPDEKSQN